MNHSKAGIDIVIPIYNEQSNLIPLYQEIANKLANKLSPIKLILIDDGSDDNPENIIKKLKRKDPNISIKYIKLTKNHGKDLAIKCGIDHVASSVCAIMDGDLQHPPEEILEAVEKIKEGYNVVHIVKEENKVDSRFRRMNSFLFNKLINFLSGSEIHLTDFKLLDDKAVKIIRDFTEINYFNRGIVDLIGLKCAKIFYQPNPRQFGNSRYSIGSLVHLAVNSLIAVSIKPLRISIYFGLTISIFSFLYGLFILFEKIFFGQAIPGFATLATALFFLGGIQLLFLGIIGEYLGKTFIEAKRRPQYMIDHIREFG